MPLFFCNIGWMERYQGQQDGDLISGGGSWVEEHGLGHEIFCFHPVQGRVYGYVQSSRFRDIKLERIDPSAGPNAVSGVTVIWVSKPIGGPNVVIGWYTNATIYRQPQAPPSHAPHIAVGVDTFNIEASASDAVLLPRDDRTFIVPRGKGWMGMSNTWFADDPNNHELQPWKDKLLAFIGNRRGKRKNTTNATRYQPDQVKKVAVELAAMSVVEKYYAGFGYDVSDVSAENRGWDLEADTAAGSLQIEVKGLSGEDISVELTANEYVAYRKNSLSYRLCVVTAAISENPKLYVFRVSSDTNKWILEGQTAHLDWTTEERPALSIRARGLKPTETY